MKPKNPDGLIPLTADLHIHSALSSCAEDRMTPDEVLKRIMGLGIEIFSITDHNSNLNCPAFHAAAGESGILFIPGIELQSSEEIHLLGYFPDLRSLEDFCTAAVRPRLLRGKRHDPSRFGNQLRVGRSGNVIGEVEDMLSMPLNISIEEVVDQVHEYKGIAVAAHLDRGFSVISQLGYIPPKLKLDAVEIRDVTKIDKFRSEFLGERELNVISSSDSHYLDMMKVPSMKLWLKAPDVAGCLACIRGDGPGRISFKKKGRRPEQKDRPPSKGDWKEIYK